MWWARFGIGRARQTRHLRTGLACATCLWCVSAMVSAGAAAAASSIAPAPEAAWRSFVRQFALDHFKQPAWGYSHSQRDYQLARELAAADSVTLDDDVLYAAAFLHDMAAFPPWEKPDADHADVAAGIVDSVLKGSGFPMAKIDAVRGAIRTHMFDRDPAGAEALYLHDADALDWLGAIGVARIIALADPKGGNPTVPQVVPMLQDNLDKVPGRVLSLAGRARVGERRQELEEFLSALRRESAELQAL